MSRQNQIASVRVMGADSQEAADTVYAQLHGQISVFFDVCHNQHILSNRGHSRFEKRVPGGVLTYINDANQPLVFVTPDPTDLPDPPETPLGKFAFAPPRTCYRQYYTITRAIGINRDHGYRFGYVYHGGRTWSSFLEPSTMFGGPFSPIWDMRMAELEGVLRSGEDFTGAFSERVVSWRNSERGVIAVVRSTQSHVRWSEDQGGPELYDEQPLLLGLNMSAYTAINGIPHSSARLVDVPVYQDLLRVESAMLFNTPEARIENAYVKNELEVFECETPGEPMTIRTDGSLVLPGDPDYDLVPSGTALQPTQPPLGTMI